MALLLCLLVGLVDAQDEATKQKAIDQMREVAKAVKQCPQKVDRVSHPDIQCFGPEAHAGPAVNVAWDVTDSKTARAPYQGYVEFDLPSSWLATPLQPSDRKVAKACSRNFQIERQGAAIWAEASLRALLGLPDDVNLPQSKVWHYRFELDVGSDNPELVKMLWTDDSGKAQAVTFGYSCWAQAAQSVGRPQPEASSQPQGKDR